MDMQVYKIIKVFNRIDTLKNVGVYSANECDDMCTLNKQTYLSTTKLGNGRVLSM